MDDSEIIVIRTRKLGEIRTAEAKLKTLMEELKAIDFVADEFAKKHEAPK